MYWNEAILPFPVTSAYSPASELWQLAGAPCTIADKVRLKTAVPPVRKGDLLRR